MVRGVWGFVTCEDDVGLDRVVATPDVAGDMQEESRVPGIVSDLH